jgi:hypothetical protein
MMKTGLTGLIRAEKGQALVLAVILLLIGGLIAAPLLAYMGTGLITGEVYEKRTAELYAADAGVEHALWKIKSGNLCPGSLPQSYNVSVNGRSVAVTIANGAGGAYRVTSSAATDSKSHTTVVADVGVTTTVGSGFLDNAITSNGTVSIGSNSLVNGNILYGTGITGNSSQSLNGTATKGNLNWPSCSDLSSYYLSQVQSAIDPGGTIDVGQGTVEKGPCYRRQGDGNLDVTGKGGTLKLTGTIYVTGNLYCRESGQGYTIDLNGQTIFVLGDADFAANHVTIKGSGCIIACGYIKFQPGIMTNPNDFVFVMSVTSYVDFQPNGDFYGAVGGDVNVNLQPNNTLTWHSLGGTTLNVPASISGSGIETVTGATIVSYAVTQQ